RLDSSDQSVDAPELARPLRSLWHAQREMLAPVTRVQMALHPWVAFGIMPVFALANSGVDLRGFDTSSDLSVHVALGVVIALVVGNPLGVMAASWLAVRSGWAKLPPGMTMGWLLLIGLLAGIG